MIPALEVCGLEKQFQGKTVFSNLNLILEPGTTTVLYGPSGIGKTTLIKCLLLLERPDSGSIYIQGETIFEQGMILSEKTIRQKVGVVFQDFYLWDNKTVLENLTESLIYVKKMPQERAIQQAQKTAGELSVEPDLLKKYPPELSRGQRQRIAIARTLALSPEIILFDEPTASLDRELVHRVVEMLRMLQSSQKTILIVSHDTAFATQVSDRVVDFRSLSN